MDPLALAVSAVVLVAVLVAAALDHPRVRPAAIALPGAVYLVLVGALGGPDAEAAVETPVTHAPPAPGVALVVVGATVAGFAVASLAGISPVWPAVGGVVVLAARQLVRRRTRPVDLVRAADLPFALFVLGLSVVVAAVLHSGLESWLAGVLPDGSGLLPLLAVAGIAALAANVLNNLPATLALLPVAAVGGPGPVVAVLVGVNVGPNLTYVGSLANLLWRRVLGELAPRSARFSAIGAATVPLTLVLATTALWASLQLG